MTFKQDDDEAIEAFSKKNLSILFEDFKHEGNNLHLARIGNSSKPVLLFIHGSPGCWNAAWDYFMDSSLHKSFELISIDRPGFGKSDYGIARNLFAQANIVSSFVSEKLKGREIHLIGHSYGGPLAMQMCKLNDTLYSRCILLAGSISPDAEKEEWQLNLFSKKALRWMAPGSFEQGILELLWLKEDLKRYKKNISSIGTPIVAVYGTEDNMVPHDENLDFLRSHFDSVQLNIHSLDGANHFLPWKRYNEVREIIKSPFEKIRKGF